MFNRSNVLLIKLFLFFSENGIYMFLWIGQAVSSDWLQNVFGVQSTHQVDKQRVINCLPIA